MEKTNRNYSLDFLKIIGATGIVFHHFQATTGARYNNFINFWGDWFNWGYLVEMFFILSGYFMYRYISSIQEGKFTLSEWWKKRAVRLLPMSAISVVFFEIVLFIHNTIFPTKLWGMEVSISGTLMAALGVQEGWGFKNPVINNSIWYISVLMICYILFYIFTALSARLKCNPIYFYIAMIFLGIGISMYGIELPFLGWQVARGYYAFFFGVLLSAYITKYGVRVRETVVSVVIFTLITLFYIFFPQYAESDAKYTTTFLLFPSIVILFETKVAHKLFRHKIWGTLSGISFEVYLWHLPVMLLAYLVMKLINRGVDVNNLASMLVFTLGMWGIGALMYFFVERPIVKALTTKKKKEEPLNE